MISSFAEAMKRSAGPILSFYVDVLRVSEWTWGKADFVRCGKQACDLFSFN